MNVEYIRPPNFADIFKVFGRECCKTGVLFTYGNTLYNPSRVPIPPSLFAHEEVHSRRQLAVLMGPELWWSNYLTDKSFRYTEELIAHQVEYLKATENGGRAERRRNLAVIAERLASPLYGKMTTKDRAKAAILAMRGAET